ncbi:MAG: glutamate--tRNA ligase, partial [Bacteroidales bacterium]|nr:glutamate--tRNA ligase [Bacteroidales bacterium]
MNNRKVRVRFAPSPTGPLHMGGVRTALFNYLFAKKNNGRFILRIEDTDQTRYVDGAEDYIVEALRWCGIEIDEGIEEGGAYGPYRQSDRKGIYKEFAERLVNSGNAYYSFDTAEELEVMREKLKAEKSSVQQYNAITRSNMKNSLTFSEKETNKLLDNKVPFVIRFKMPENEKVIVEDIIRGTVTVNTSQLDDKVLFKSDGMPTYHLANIVDDHLMEISHVLRGEDHITNIPKQMMIYKAFKWTPPIFGHMTLIVNENNKKLSKRDFSIIQYIEQYQSLGYLPDALFNFISLLGWSPKGEEEILSHDDLIEMFDETRLSKSPAKFDKEKLAYINNRYIKELSIEETIELCMPHLTKEGITEDKSEDWIYSLVSV